jgi:hypothetical protein
LERAVRKIGFQEVCGGSTFRTRPTTFCVLISNTSLKYTSGMQPAVIESNELTSQSKIYLSDVLQIIVSTQPMFSGGYGEMDHIFNGTDHQLLKKAHGIAGLWRITEESGLNFPSALSIRTTLRADSQFQSQFN